jgi:altronate hydrolase
MIKRITLVLDARDNVASALAELAAQQIVNVEVPGASRQSIIIRQPVPLGHKFALHPIAQGEPVVKYGLPIGLATCDIAPGEHVHVHNVTGEGLGA